MKKLTPIKTILKTSLPAVIDLSSQTFMWTIEAIFIGKLSAAAFAGVGMAIQVILVFFSVLLTFVVGASLIINRHLGARDFDKANHIFAQAMMMGIIMAVVFALIWYSGAIHLFKIIKEGESSLAEMAGVTYIRTVALFAPLLITNFVAVGILRAIGDTKYSMTVNVLVNSINLMLCPTLIFGLFGMPELGVKGAALAVGIAHSIGFCVTFYLLRSRKVSLYLNFRELTTPKWESFKQLFRSGYPTTIEQMTWAVGQLVVTSYAAGIGVIVLSTHTVFVRIQSILSMVYMGFSLAAMSIMGKNLGAAENALAYKMARTAHRVMAGFVIGIVAIMVLFSKALIYVFTTDKQVLALGSMAIYIFAFAQIPKALNNVLSGNLRGVGDLKWLMWITIVFVVLFEMGLNWVSAFILGWGIYGIWGIQSLDETLRFGLNYLRFAGGSWRTEGACLPR
ncbi:MATE family efflux transporter [candidate division KSB1 bacterium]|nr:MATE family efflux transporter [candidate division KSB1 bacterium]